MNDLLAAALRIVAPVNQRPDALMPGTLPPLPTALPYADYVRRFDPTADPLEALSRASAVAHLVRLHRTVETLHGFAHARGGRARLDSDHLYQAHGEPRD